MTRVENATEDRPASQRPVTLWLALLMATCAPAPYPGSQTIATIAAIGLILVTTWRAPRFIMLPFMLPLVFCAFAAASSVWSPLPLQSLRGALVFALLTVAIWAAARVLVLEDVLIAMLWAFRIVLVASIVIAIVRPDIGLDNTDYQTGALRGLFIHRNTLAYVSTIAILTAWFSRSLRSRVSLVGDLGLGIVCLLGAQSQSSLVVTVATFAFLLALTLTRHFRGPSRLVVSLLIAATCSAGTYWATNSLSVVTEALGRDQTLTGRTEIWAAVLQEISYHPVLGAGWNATWEFGLPITYRMWSAIGFSAFSAHDGYLDVLLQLGIAGMALLGLVFGVALTRSVRLALSDAATVAAWPAAITFAALISNISESHMTVISGWLLLCIACVFPITRRQGTRSTTTKNEKIDDGAADVVKR